MNRSVFFAAIIFFVGNSSLEASDKRNQPVWPLHGMTPSSQSQQAPRRVSQPNAQQQQQSNVQQQGSLAQPQDSSSGWNFAAIGTGALFVAAAALNYLYADTKKDNEEHGK
jgi:hypothetical protein